MWRAPRLMNSVRSRSLNHDASSPRVPPIHSSQGATPAPGFSPLLFHASRLLLQCCTSRCSRAEANFQPLFVPEQALLQRRVRGRRSVKTISLSPRTFGACACLFGGFVSSAEEIRDESLFTTPVMRRCFWATETRSWLRFRKRICADRGLNKCSGLTSRCYITRS